MLTWKIAGRLVGRIGARAAVVPLLVVVAFVFATNVFFDEQTLTGHQEVQRQLGDDAAKVSRTSITIPPGSAIAAQVQNDLNTRKAGAEVVTQVLDFPLYTVDEDGLYYQERDWSPAPFPDAMRLRSGRMPDRPGEVALLGAGHPGSPRLGDRLSVLSDAGALRVVGFVDNLLTTERRVLAAPGTFAGLRASGPTELSQLTASLTFYFATVPGPSQMTALSDVLRSRKLLPAGAASSPDALLADVVDRGKAAADEEAPWTARSPLSFWVPALLFTPLAAGLVFLVLMRRLGPALRNMARVGVRRRTAVGGAWLAVVVWVVVGSLPAAALGSLAGHLVAQWGANGWGNPGAIWRFPVSAARAAPIGLLLGLVIGWFLLGRSIPVLASGPSSASERTSPRRQRISATTVQNVRHVACILLAGAVIVQAGRVERSVDGMILTGLVALLAGLLTPDVVDRVLAVLPHRTLNARLTSRLLQAHRARVVTTSALLVLCLAATVGFLTAVEISLQAERATASPIAPPGYVGLDNDGSPNLPVAPEVVSAAESVPALAARRPVQLWTPGRWRTPDIEDSLYLRDSPWLSFAVDSPEEIARVFGRPLTTTERATLVGGGALVIDKELSLDGGQLSVVDEEGRPRGSFRAVRSDTVVTPWFGGAPAVFLTSTLKERGYDVFAAAKVYTGIPAADAKAVPAALAERGINPENVDIHTAPKPIIPDGALIGSSIGLFGLMLLVAGAMTRSQVIVMRTWASRLTQLGVPLRWARSVILRQYAWILAIAIPLGLLAGLLPLWYTHLAVPKIALAIPWRLIAPLLAALIGSVILSAVIASRRLTSQEALGWTDHGD